ncbi:hypothetical protein [Croceibacter atlanticus]|jgi:hypothetical protein|uniref:Uncharacterized protein n=1 Tax=Croceibacter atlanticus (strain ATCC BAA-628 / JCM 21780 / CIP 108009 / IAM 15332 / KCTC 12090 / HTCC2559) TaxID=216432 RepID=A3U6S8_CROAH|nr:hypothetical protein [Croceibacter atlanticus]EAP87945.1 hypothetical protein CA2559_04280 [Croceibacter atlanticus HTCC2559]
MNFIQKFGHGKNYKLHPAPEVGEIDALTEEEIIKIKEYLRLKRQVGANKYQYTQDENDFINKYMMNEKSKFEKSKSKGKGTSILLIAVVVIGGLFLVAQYFDRTMYDDEVFSNGKEKSEWTFSDWKNKADFEAEKFYKCAKDYDYSQNSGYEYCSRDYQRAWIFYKDYLNNLANLPTSQISQLKDYWNTVSEQTVAKISSQIDRNENSRRNKKY